MKIKNLLLVLSAILLIAFVFGFYYLLAWGLTASAASAFNYTYEPSQTYFVFTLIALLWIMIGSKKTKD